MGMEILEMEKLNGNMGMETRIETADLCRCTAGGCWDSMCTRRFGVVTKISGRGERRRL